jgi:hypothetical protein
LEDWLVKQLIDAKLFSLAAWHHDFNDSLIYLFDRDHALSIFRIGLVLKVFKSKLTNILIRLN